MAAPGARDIIEAVRARRINWNPFTDFDVRTFGVSTTSTDNSAAIAAAYSALGTRGQLSWPPGDIFYSSPLVFTGQKRPAFIGSGPAQTRLIYNGSDTTVDCITIGDGVLAEPGWDINNIGFFSNTVMTSGTGLHINGMVRSRLLNVHVGDQDTNSDFYIACWFDGVDFVFWDGCQARGSFTSLRANGRAALGLADLYINNYKIIQSTVGLHVAGSLGGLHMGVGGITNNGTNVLIDKTITGTNNREVNFGPHCAIDSACTTHDAATFDGINVDIQDTSGITIFKNAWNASAATNIRVGASFAGTILLLGGRVFNAFNTFGGNGHAIDINSASTKLYVGGTYFENCQGAGIASSVATTNVILNHPQFTANVVNPVDANISATSFTTYQTDNVADMGTLAVGDRSIYATSVNGSPQFGISGSAGTLQAWNSGAGNPWFVLGHSRGGSVPGTQGALLVNDQLGGISFEGSDGTALRAGAQIQSQCTTAPAGSQITANLFFRVNNGAGMVTQKTLSAAGDLTNVAGTTGMNAGFMCIPSAAGVPSGTPAVASGNVPLYWDSTNLQLYVYTGGAWKKSAVFT